MRNAFITGQRHCQRNGNAVVRPQGGVIGVQPIAINNILDGVFRKVMGRVGGFFAHHVHMALNNDGRCVFISRCRRHFDQQVAGGVLVDRQLFCLSPVFQPLPDLLFFFRTARDGIDLREVIQYRVYMLLH